LEEWVDILTLHRQGLGIKTIARRLNISRNTVRNAIRRGTPPVYKRALRPSKLDPFKDYIIQRLSDFPELSCERLFKEIVAQGYTGKKTILKDFTKPYRLRRKEPIVRFETLPGQQAQVDWAELGTHWIKGEKVKLYLFVMVLGYSRCTYSEVVKKTDVETLIACHRRAFSYFGGATNHILYDNMKTVVIKRDKTGNHRFNSTFLDFSATVGFRARLCRPYRAKTKGKVERTIRYIKDSFLVGRTFYGFEDINNKLRAWLDMEANVRIHATTGEIPFVRLAKENLLLIDERILVNKADVLTKTRKPSFVFEPPVVEKRLLDVYEEAVT